ncbi:hypothetical protein OUZ56_012465 [Daphnia magna]|uniref:Uncharacterized protein n=1 Tax=Daphnia magna TaxID=35525 RepID=A0ABQ9Z333_9CRUS|nr:hypothetical protein OUZ56_012465 [Daphnia magna]
MSVRDEALDLIKSNNLPHHVVCLLSELLHLPAPRELSKGVNVNDGKILLLGATTGYRNLTIFEEIAIRNYSPSLRYKEFPDSIKVVETQSIFTTSSYNRSPKRNNYCAFMEDGNFFKIESIFTIEIDKIARAFIGGELRKHEGFITYTTISRRIRRRFSRFTRAGCHQEPEAIRSLKEREADFQSSYPKNRTQLIWLLKDIQLKHLYPDVPQIKEWKKPTSLLKYLTAILEVKLTIRAKKTKKTEQHASELTAIFTTYARQFLTFLFGQIYNITDLRKLTQTKNKNFCAILLNVRISGSDPCPIPKKPSVTYAIGTTDPGDKITSGKTGQLPSSNQTKQRAVGGEYQTNANPNQNKLETVVTIEYHKPTEPSTTAVETQTTSKAITTQRLTSHPEVTQSVLKSTTPFLGTTVISATKKFLKSGTIPVSIPELVQNPQKRSLTSQFPNPNRKMAYSLSHTRAAIVKVLEDFQNNQHTFSRFQLLPSFSGSPITRFDSWLESCESIVDGSGWSNEKIIQTLRAKFTVRVFSVIQAILKENPGD